MSGSNHLDEIEPHRMTIVIEWLPSASIGEPHAMQTLVGGMATGLLRVMEDWGVTEPSVQVNVDDSPGQGDGSDVERRRPA